jgi:hypothetical protein
MPLQVVSCIDPSLVFVRVQIFGQIATQTSAPSEARVMVARTLRDLQGRHPGSMGPLLAQLTQEQQATLQQLMAAAS